MMLRCKFHQKGEEERLGWKGKVYTKVMAKGQGFTKIVLNFPICPFPTPKTYNQATNN